MTAHRHHRGQCPACIEEGRLLAQAQPDYPPAPDIAAMAAASLQVLSLAEHLRAVTSLACTYDCNTPRDPYVPELHRPWCRLVTAMAATVPEPDECLLCGNTGPHAVMGMDGYIDHQWEPRRDRDDDD